MSGAFGPHEPFVEKVAAHLYQTVVDKIGVLMSRQGLEEDEATAVVVRLRARLAEWTPAPGQDPEAPTRSEER
jgi:hypothetical protein